MTPSPSVRLALPSQHLPLEHLSQSPTHTDRPYTLSAPSTTSSTFQDQPPSHLASTSFSPFQIRHSQNATSSAPPRVAGPNVIHTSIPNGRSALDTQYFNHFVAQVASHFKDQQILFLECSILMKRLGSRQVEPDEFIQHMDILLRERQDLLVALGMLLLPQHRQQLLSRIEARNQMLTGNDFGSQPQAGQKPHMPINGPKKGVRQRHPKSDRLDDEVLMKDDKAATLDTGNATDQLKMSGLETVVASKAQAVANLASSLGFIETVKNRSAKDNKPEIYDEFIQLMQEFHLQR
ncbi:hypothetical protein AGABI2DRAFT_120753 [Agaricus bisporus var. bisporus H97]|uniref:hypothetical protein n=1 Tax=Agaricus bisporus var. bisporus (strain H97 / ATCC MYA-4626 / FGSC 10389) TaxID=936046 RepID=UPI00029F6A1E|nr:hypothetical protein AGABI2DRAFT_120753 [Agaricus bisporus var. bisporus H97]EKV44626.1 hypothetical protein AGABI2DRAFT_120753 [Agaricus bisporus var. bisporus H97]